MVTAASAPSRPLASPHSIAPRFSRPVSISPRLTIPSYSGDTSLSEPFIEAAAGADVLIHECTFDDDHAAVCTANSHSNRSTLRVPAEVAEEELKSTLKRSSIRGHIAYSRGG